MTQKRKISLSAYTLIILTVFLVGVLSFVAVILVQQRKVAGTGESTRALQLVGEGLEEIVSAYRENSPIATVGEVAVGECKDGVVTRHTSEGKYEVMFIGSDDVALTSCDDLIVKISKVRVTATAKDSSAPQVIETAFATAGAYQMDCVPFPVPDGKYGNTHGYIQHTQICCLLDTSSGKAKCLRMRNTDDYGWTEFGDGNDMF